MKRTMRRNLWLCGSGAIAAGAAAAAIWHGSGMDLRGKVVLITGGSRGLGIAMARTFAQQGARLALSARNEEELDAARDDLRSLHAEVLTIRCDVADRDRATRAVEETVRHYGRLDVLVNNAGIIQVGPIDSLSVEDFEQAMNVMFWGVVYTTLAALPHLRQRPEARIVNITSIGGKVSVPHLLPYSCAKFAAVAFSEGLRAELRGTGIRVVTIAPGLMRTGSYFNGLFKGDAEKEATWFSAAASLPGLSIGAARAARQIVAATRRGRAERVLSMPANVLAKFHGVFPGLTAEILGVVNALLPRGGEQRESGAEIEILHRRGMRLLTWFGRRAAKRYLQPAASRA